MWQKLVWYGAPDSYVCHATFVTLCNSTAEAMQLLPWWTVGVSRAPPDAQNQPVLLDYFKRVLAHQVICNVILRD